VGDLKVTIEHGSGLSSLLNGKTALIVAAVVVIGAGGGASGLVSGLTDLLYWLAGVMVVLVVAGGYLIYRATRHAKGQNYVQSINGPSQRNILIDEQAALRREINRTRAMRYDIERARIIQAALAPQDPHRAWSAEVVEP
jgi:uncharacterized membrane protein